MVSAEKVIVATFWGQPNYAVTHKNKFEVSYSPDLTPNDFWLFPTPKVTLYDCSNSN